LLLRRRGVLLGRGLLVPLLLRRRGVLLGRGLVSLLRLVLRLVLRLCRATVGWGLVTLLRKRLVEAALLGRWGAAALLGGVGLVGGLGDVNRRRGVRLVCVLCMLCVRQLLRRRLCCSPRLRGDGSKAQRPAVVPHSLAPGDLVRLVDHLRRHACVRNHLHVPHATPDHVRNALAVVARTLRRLPQSLGVFVPSRDDLQQAITGMTIIHVPRSTTHEWRSN